MNGTGDPCNVAAEGLLLVLSEYESIIDHCAETTYNGDLIHDLLEGDGYDIRNAEIHVERTFWKVAIKLAGKLMERAQEADDRILDMLEED